MSSPPSSRKRFTAAVSTVDLKPSYTRFQAGRKLFSCLPVAR
jgi:hypothetical protein